MTIYQPTARFDTGRPLTEDEMHKRAPSIFALQAHESRSERFKPIPTIEILRGLAKEGFHPVGAMQSGARSADRRDFTKHLIRLRRFDDQVARYQVGDTVCEILLKNANDGSSAYELMAGLFRIRCLNSLVSQTGTIDTLKVRHSGDALGKVIEGTYTVLESARTALEAPVEWSKINLDRREREAFAESVHTIRFADAEGNVDTPITPAQFLIPRRAEDQRQDLWHTFNVAQENAIRGGLTARRPREPGQRTLGRRTTTREIKGIDQNVAVNKALWMLAERMAELKRAA